MAFATRPRVPSAADTAKRMVDGAASAGQRFVDGALAPRRDPIEAAKKSVARYNTNTQKAIAEGRFLKGLQGVDVEAMCNTIRQIGASAYVQGIQARQGKIETKLAKMAPLMEAHLRTIDAMPASTDQEREARVIANIRGMKDIGTKLRGM